VRKKFTHIPNEIRIHSLKLQECKPYSEITLLTTKMERLIRKTITICTTAITLCTLISSAQAQERWSGNGYIIDGYDKGAVVELDVKVDSSTATIQSYPAPGEQVPLNRPTQTKTGNWEMYPCNDDLCVTLEQDRPPRTIYYRLEKK
jgi:hypothetical protein